MIFGLLAFALTAVFTGAAVYINVVEQPARLRLSNDALLAEWQVAYPRGMVMQGGLAVIVFVLGSIAFWIDGHWVWAVGALLMICNWPYTFAALMPLNKSLMATPSAAATEGTRDDVIRWERLHRVRTMLGFAATIVFGAAIVMSR